MAGVVGKPLVPTLQRQRQADVCDFEASVIYIVSSSPAKALY